MTTSSVSPAAGWYEDPWKHAPLRFWDGATWTDATASSPPVAAQMATATKTRTDQEKGAVLEGLVASFLRSIGYNARTNVVLTGRSGATHEVDVLAEKSDQLTSFRVAVECKAWEHPIEKDVVAKFAYVLNDLGIREGIVACLSGWRSGAETAAREMGVTLWGPDELRSRLGQVVLSDMSVRAPTRLAPGLQFNMSIEQARPLVDREAKGKLGFGAESVVWMSPAWMPVAFTQIALTTVEGRLKKVPLTRRIWNAYDLLDGRLVGSFDGAPPLADVDLGGVAIRPRVKDADVRRSVEDAVGKYRSVSTEAAKARHAQRLNALGIPAPFRAVPESSTIGFIPLYIAIVRRRDGERVVAVEAHNQFVHPGLSSVLSNNVHWVRESFAAS